MENNFHSLISYDVLIVGAGPAGLSLAYHLKKLNISYLILEQNDCVGSSWRQMPEHLHLISLWKSNCLIKEDLPLSSPYKAHSANEFADYLESFAQKHELNIKTQIKVLEIKKEKEFEINFSKDTLDTFRSKLVVDCRGYFNYPFVPDYPIVGEPPFMIHFKDYKNRSQMSKYENVLIVGKRLSAGQLIVELANEKRHNLFLSKRSELHFSSRPFILNYFLRHLDVFEGVAKKLTKNIKQELEVPMHFAAKKIIDDKVQIVGEIKKIEGKKIFFTDGKTQTIDAIIFATGFRPPEIQLKNDFESSTTEGLLYLGRGSQRTFTSRFIRGIREDAEVLAQVLFEKLRSNTNSH